MFFPVMEKFPPQKKDELPSGASCLQVKERVINLERVYDNQLTLF